MFELTIEAKQSLYVAVAGLLIAAVISMAAYSCGYFSLKHSKTDSSAALPWSVVVIAFSLFVGLSMVVVPGLFFAWLILFRGYFIDNLSFDFSDEASILLNTAIIGLNFVALLVFILFLPNSWRQIILGRRFALSWQNGLQDFCMGALSWFVSYPWVAALSSLIAAAIIQFYGKIEVDQVAVKEVKAYADKPGYLFLIIFLVVVLVPFVEELLFRGILQSWLKQKFGFTFALITASLIFSLFHYSASQEVLNVEIIPALFLLACFLGFLFERQSSLTAPLALHSIFNAVSIVLMLY